METRIDYDKINNKEISKGMINLLIQKDLSLDYVSKNSDKLDKLYEHIYKSLGFNNFYDCYLYATYQPSHIEKSGENNEDNLNKVKRKVVRNGKEIELTVTKSENPEDDTKEQKQDKEIQEPKNRSALGSKIISNGEEGKVNPQKVANALYSISKTGTDTSHMDANASIYKEFIDEEGNTIGLVAFNVTNSDIILHSYASAEDSEGVGKRAIIELIKLSIQHEKNAIVYDIDLPEAIEFLKILGFETYKDGYILNKKDVQEFIGEFRAFI
ncbi:virion structural protein [Staphylococcus phage CF5]|uniref:Virion structural protein n=1 Tax=Staphylococcus phage CF5 TaxID=3113739 RepID=A0AAX4J6X0_9CAUD|nr:virion structural protein [Staphylococcus phage CF5]